MSEPSALYLFKAARRPLYRKENLHLLAADRGSIVEVGYNRMWVAPEYVEDAGIARGTPVYFVFTERPYSLFVPVRQAEVVDVEEDDLLLRFRVLLRSWVRTEETLEDFTRLVKATQHGRAPGNKFVLPKRDEVELRACYDEQEDEGWRGVVDDVVRASRESEDDPYRTSVFFRPLGLRTNGETYVARRVPLEADTEGSLLLRFYNPHLNGSDRSERALRVLAPADELRIEAPESFPLCGDLEIPFQVVGGNPEVTVQVLPSPAEHTSVTERFIGREREESDDDSSASAISPRDLLGLYDSVRRNAVFDDPGDHLDFLSELQRLLPDEAVIAEERALLYWATGEEETAFRLLREIDADRLGDEARLLLFRLLLRKDTDTSPEHHISSLDLTAEARFPRFLEALDEYSARDLARLLPRLVLDLPDEQRRDLMECHGGRVDSPTAIVEIAGNLAIADQPVWAYNYLDERRRTLHLNDPEITDMLLRIADLGGRTEPDLELADDIARWIGNLIEQGNIEKAQSQLRVARDGLSRDQRNRLFHRIADHLARKQRFADAAQAMIELAYAALATGDLEDALEAARTASGAVERAHGLAARAERDDLALAVEEVTALVETAWRSCEPLAEWRRSAEEFRREQLQAAYLGRRILIAGGVRNPQWTQYFGDLTAAKVDWCESFHDQTDDVDAAAERIRNGHYAIVVHYLQKSGHDLGARLKPACAEAGVPFAPATSAGRRGVEEALYSRCEPARIR